MSAFSKLIVNAPLVLGVAGLRNVTISSTDLWTLNPGVLFVLSNQSLAYESLT